MTRSDKGIVAARAERVKLASGRSEAIASALFDALCSADPALVAALGAEVEAHQQKYRAKKGIVRSGQPVAPLLRSLEDAISEAAELAADQA